MSGRPTVFAEAPVVPGAVFDLRLWIDVQEWTLLVTALTWGGGGLHSLRHQIQLARGLSHHTFFYLR